jgi:hypothetical protein
MDVLVDKPLYNVILHLLLNDYPLLVDFLLDPLSVRFGLCILMIPLPVPLWIGQVVERQIHFHWRLLKVLNSIFRLYMYLWIILRLLLQDILKCHFGPLVKLRGILEWTYIIPKLRGCWLLLLRVEIWLITEVRLILINLALWLLKVIVKLIDLLPRSWDVILGKRPVTKLVLRLNMVNLTSLRLLMAHLVGRIIVWIYLVISQWFLRLYVLVY